MFRVRKGKLLLAAAAAATLPDVSFAQNFNWTFSFGGTGSANWSTTSNWNPNTSFPNAPNAQATLTTAGVAGGAGQINMTAAHQVATLNFFSSGANGYTLAGAGGTLALVADGRISVPGTNVGTIQSPISVPASSVWHKIGPGTLILSGASTYSNGGLNVADGVVDIRDSGALTGMTIISTAGNGQVILNNVTTPGSFFVGLGSSGAPAAGMLQASGASTVNGSMFVVAPNGSVGVTTGSNLNLNGVVIDGTGTESGFMKTGAGTFTADNLRLNGALTVNGGTAKIKAGATPNLAAGTSSTSALTVGGGGALDMTNNKLLVNYGTAASPGATIRGYLTTGYAGGLWNGAGINTSSGNTTDFALGYVDGNDNPGGFALGVAAGQVEVIYTRYGDLNLDGLVNATDAARFLANFGKVATRWIDGDLTYDGLVNAADASKFLANFGKAAGFTPGPALGPDDLVALSAIQALVPEPSLASLALLGGIGMLGRRNRRKNA